MVVYDMDFASRQTGGCTFWRGSGQQQSNRGSFSNWNAPKPFAFKPMRFQYRGAVGGRNLHRNIAKSCYTSRPYDTKVPYRTGGEFSWKRGSDSRQFNVGRNRERWTAPLRPRENELSRNIRERSYSSCPRRRYPPSSPSTFKRNRPASMSPRCRRPSTPGKENVRQPEDSGSNVTASPLKTVATDPVKSVQLYGGKSMCLLEQSRCLPPSPVSKHSTDPLYVGLPNLGNSCYQNATLQALLGVTPFVAESVATALRLFGRASSRVCPTLRALSTLMVLRQQARRQSVSSHVNRLRDVFAAIDPVFRGSQMQDANEFLLRLLDTLKDELDAGDRLANPVRASFEYETQEVYRCCRCGEQAHRRQTSISWFVNVPRRAESSSAPPTLQDALRLSVRPDQRELTCEHCGHSTCTVATRISRLPRVLILQLNRYVYLSQQARKIRSSVQIPRFISLNEYVSDDVASPASWDCLGLPAECSSLVLDVENEESVSAGDKTASVPEQQDCPVSSGPSETVASTPAAHECATESQLSPTAVAAAPAPATGSCDAHQQPGDQPVDAERQYDATIADVASATAPSVATAADSCVKTSETRPDEAVTASDQTPELVVMDGELPGGDEERELQEAIRLSLQEEQNQEDGDKLSEFCVEDDVSRSAPADLTGHDTYRLVGVVSHYGSATHSGHYVSDVYSVARQRWLHYDDRRVCDVTEDDVIGETPQRNGYIFFYMHKSVCDQVANVDMTQC